MLLSELDMLVLRPLHHHPQWVAKNASRCWCFSWQQEVLLTISEFQLDNELWNSDIQHLVKSLFRPQCRPQQSCRDVLFFQMLYYNLHGFLSLTYNMYLFWILALTNKMRDIFSEHEFPIYPLLNSSPVFLLLYRELRECGWNGKVNFLLSNTVQVGLQLSYWNRNYCQTKTCLRVPCSALIPLFNLLCVVSTSILRYSGGVIAHMNEIEAIDFCKL